MNMGAFCYIQRLRLGKVECAPGVRFGQAFELEYMGASEYEFGAFPAFLRAAHDRIDQLVEVKASIVYDKALGLSYPITCFYDPHAMTWEHIENQLVMVAQGKQRTKMSAGFPGIKRQQTTPPRGPRKAVATIIPSETCGWVDVGNNVFWTAREITLDQYKGLLRESVEYMDAQKAQT
jgi:hypothetical protein